MIRYLRLSILVAAVLCQTVGCETSSESTWYDRSARWDSLVLAKANQIDAVPVDSVLDQGTGDYTLDLQDAVREHEGPVVIGEGVDDIEYRNGRFVITINSYSVDFVLVSEESFARELQKDAQPSRRFIVATIDSVRSIVYLEPETEPDGEDWWSVELSDYRKRIAFGTVVSASGRYTWDEERKSWTNPFDFDSWDK